jgi:hypothetical protein
VSLNGVMEAPGGEKTHPHTGWTFESIYGEDHYDYKPKELEAAGSALLGRKTYEGFTAAWPQREGPFAEKINTMLRYVVASTLTDPEWENMTVLSGDPLEEVRKLKETAIAGRRPGCRSGCRARARSSPQPGSRRASTWHLSWPRRSTATMQRRQSSSMSSRCSSAQRRRLFEALAAEQIELERTRMLEGENGVTYMR